MSQEQKKQISKEDLQKLLAQMAAAKQGKKPPMSLPKRMFNGFLVFCSNQVHYLDRFINFVVKPVDPNRNDVLQHSRSPILFGTYVVFLFVFLGGGWAAMAPLYSAAGAGGKVIVATNKQVINHQDGGNIKSINVKVGDSVKKGQNLIEFDVTRYRGEYEVTLLNYRNYLANEARLLAERDELSKIEYPEDLLKNSDQDEVKKIIYTQEKLFSTKMNAYKSRIESDNHRKEQNIKLLQGLKARKDGNIKMIKHLKERFDSTQKLVLEGYSQQNLLSQIEAEVARYESEDKVLDSEILKHEQENYKIASETNSFINQHLSEISNQLKEYQHKLSESKEQLLITTDRLDRAVVKSPVEGTVNDIKVHTVGGVVQPYQPFMEITPVNEKLIIQAKIPSGKIAYVTEGLDAKVRISAFKSRTTPVFDGKVVSVSPDVVEDQMERHMMPYKSMADDAFFYTAKIELNQPDFDNIAKERNLKLLPGMNAEIQIITGKRTLLRYLLDPITDNMFKAFIEK